MRPSDTSSSKRYSGRLIVAADAIVVAVPGSGIFQKRIGALQNPQVRRSDGLLAGLHTKLLPDPPADDDDAHDDGRAPGRATELSSSSQIFSVLLVGLPF